MKKHLRGSLCLLGAVLALCGCNIDDVGQQQQPASGAPTQAAGQEADPSQPGAGGGPNVQGMETFKELNQLAAGTLHLQSTEHPVTAEQAVTLLPLWQSLQSSMQPAQPAEGANSTPAPLDETQIGAALDSIKAVLTSEQTDIINNLTQEQMADVYQQQGIGFGGFGGPPGDGTPRPDDGTRGPNQGQGGGPGPGNGTPGAGPGGGQGQPPADFTPGARGNRGGLGFGSPLIDAVIRMLQSLAGQ